MRNTFNIYNQPMITYLEQKSMEEKAKEQKEVVRCVHVFTLNTDDTRTPEWTNSRLVHVIPWKATELEDVLQQNHNLQQQSHSLLKLQ